VPLIIRLDLQLSTLAHPSHTPTTVRALIWPQTFLCLRTPIAGVKLLPLLLNLPSLGAPTRIHLAVLTLTPPEAPRLTPAVPAHIPPAVLLPITHLKVLHSANAHQSKPLCCPALLAALSLTHRKVLPSVSGQRPKLLSSPVLLEVSNQNHQEVLHLIHPAPLVQTVLPSHTPPAQLQATASEPTL
jgi:hypothetical protein